MDDLIRSAISETNVDENPYFTTLEDGTFDHEDFLATQVQFYFAVDFFSRPMAAVAAKIPTARQRMEILRNVWEEHGEGEPRMTHQATFLALLERLGGPTKEVVDATPIGPEVRIFNTTLVGAAVLDDMRVGVAMMGVIERMFVDISRRLGRGIVARGWLPPERLVHYDLHEELDVRHSEDFFAILRPEWEGSAEGRYHIAQGLRLGATVFDGLYRGLYRTRARRPEPRA